jgi:hypothetical protein
MPKATLSADAPRLPALTRRGFLGTAAATLITPQAAATQTESELTALGLRFEQALSVYEAAQRRFNDCEGRYFGRKPPRPAALTSAGPLGHLLPHDGWSWSAKELRWLLADPDARADWGAARTVLSVARRYEARLRRLSRVVGLDEAEAAYHAAGDALHELCRRVADQPARSLGGLAVKARVMKRYAAPDWWREASTPERIAAQVCDAVIAMAEQREVA